MVHRDYSRILFPLRNDMRRIGRLFHIASEVKPLVPLSGYPVRGACYTTYGNFHAGWNVETSDGQALHMERNLTGRLAPGEKIKYLAIIAGTEGNLATPCGDCRNGLLDFMVEQGYIFMGGIDGGLVESLAFSDLLFEDYTRMSAWTDMEERQVHFTFGTPDYTPYQGVAYKAMIDLEPGGLVTGATVENAAFYPTGSLEAAFVSLMSSRNGLARIDVSRLIIVSAEGQPRVSYRDRQIAAELAGIRNIVKGDERPIDVLLAHVDREGEILDMWRTDTLEWFPYGFGPDNLGPAVRERIMKALEP